MQRGSYLVGYKKGCAASCSRHMLLNQIPVCFEKAKTTSELMISWYMAACLTSVLNSSMICCLQEEFDPKTSKKPKFSLEFAMKFQKNIGLFKVFYQNSKKPWFFWNLPKFQKFQDQAYLSNYFWNFRILREFVQKRVGITFSFYWQCLNRGKHQELNVF